MRRAEQLAALRSRPGASYAGLARADRAVRVVPPADAPATGLGTATENFDRHIRHELTVRHARRLLDDFAPDHAAALLKMDSDAYPLETEEHAAAARRASAMAAAALSLEPGSTAPMVFKDWEKRYFEVTMSARGAIPSGDAAVRVLFDASKPMSVTAARTGADARRLTRVAVESDAQAERARYNVSRTESTAEPVETAISARSFYRGQVASIPRDLSASFEPVAELVRVTISQSMERLKGGFTDQFKEHPGEGYMHPRNNLRYKLELEARENIRAYVLYQLKRGNEVLGTATATHPLLVGRTTVVVPKESEFKATSGSVPSSAFPDGQAGYDTIVYLYVEVRRDGPAGARLSTRHYPFRVIPPTLIWTSSTPSRSRTTG